MVPLKILDSVEQQLLKQASIVAYGSTLTALLVLFFTNDTSSFSRHLRNITQMAAYAVIAMSLWPIGLRLLWHFSPDTADIASIRDVVAAAATLCFLAMQQTGSRQGNVQSWNWLDQFFHHAFILDLLLFWNQRPEIVPTLAALLILAVLQTLLPSDVVRWFANV